MTRMFTSKEVLAEVARRLDVPADQMTALRRRFEHIQACDFLPRAQKGRGRKAMFTADELDAFAEVMAMGLMGIPTMCGIKFAKAPFDSVGEYQIEITITRRQP